MASSASAITASSPMDTAPPKSRSAAGYSPLRLHQHHSRSTIASDLGGSPAIHSTSAQAAAATCNRSVGCLPAIQSAPNGTTRHDPASPIRPPLAPRAPSADSHRAADLAGRVLVTLIVVQASLESPFAVVRRPISRPLTSRADDLRLTRNPPWRSPSLTPHPAAPIQSP